MDQSIRILAVDDETDTLEFISLALERSGIDVDWALSATEALQRASNFRYSLILTDLFLGAGSPDGLWLFQELRKSPALADIPIVIHSGCDDGIARALKRFGFSDVIQKPAVPENLCTAVSKLIRAPG